jgi:hypothetical protein
MAKKQKEFANISIFVLNPSPEQSSESKEENRKLYVSNLQAHTAVQGQCTTNLNNTPKKN